MDDTSNGVEISSLGWGEGYQSMLVLQPEVSKGMLVLTNKDAGFHQMKGLCGAFYQQWIND